MTYSVTLRAQGQSVAVRVNAGSRIEAYQRARMLLAKAEVVVCEIAKQEFSNA